MAEKIERLTDLKIDLEIEALSEIIPDIYNIENIDENKYKEICFTLKKQLDEYFKNSKLNEKTYNIYIQILNDIFNFCFNGYINIPDEYLYKIEDI